MTLHIQLLGPFDTRPGIKPPFPRKGTALLAYLAIRNGAPVERMLLAALLWERQDLEQGLHSLRNLLLTCRHQGLGAHVFGSFREIALLDFTTDLQAVKRDGILTVEDAARHAGAVFCDGMWVDGEAFDEWICLERRKASELIARQVGALVDRFIAAADHDRAVEAARILVRMDEIDEASWRVLLRAYMAAGRWNAARRCYADLERVLWRELHAPPEPATRAVIAGNAAAFAMLGAPSPS